MPEEPSFLGIKVRVKDIRGLQFRPILASPFFIIFLPRDFPCNGGLEVDELGFAHAAARDGARRHGEVATVVGGLPRRARLFM